MVSIRRYPDSMRVCVHACQSWQDPDRQKRDVCVIPTSDGRKGEASSPTSCRPQMRSYVNVRTGRRSRSSLGSSLVCLPVENLRRCVHFMCLHCTLLLTKTHTHLQCKSCFHLPRKCCRRRQGNNLSMHITGSMKHTVYTITHPAKCLMILCE